MPHWFEELADHMGSAYLRYSFTRGTFNEVDALVALSGIGPGARVLDVGCGPGRHALELASRGIDVVGVDISRRFVNLARAAAVDAGLDRATFEIGDARELERLGLGANFDLVISLCQGAFGLSAGPGAMEDRRRELDEPILAAMAGAVRPGGSVIVSAFSAYFQLRHLEDGDAFDAGPGVNREVTSVRDEDGNELSTSLWTTCYTPRELRLLARVAGLEVDRIAGVTPGRYEDGPPGIDHPEFLLVARRPMT